MLTDFYFVRHAQPNYDNHDDVLRELSEKGLQDRVLVTRFLADRDIGTVLSSPYKRAADTVRPFAEAAGLPVILIEGFRERKIDGTWLEDYDAFARRQWADFDYKLPEGESLGEVQRRNIAALKDCLRAYAGKRIAVGSHGTALSTIIRYFDPSFGYDDFKKIVRLMPWIVKFSFSGEDCIGIETFDLFTGL